MNYLKVESLLVENDHESDDSYLFDEGKCI